MPILDEWTLDFISSSVEQTVRLGIRLGQLLQPRDFLCLSGELGAGKTALARGIGRGWGTTNRVTSPTFTLVNEYPRPHDGRILYHIDCYRLESSSDIATVGLDDIFDNDATFMVEWPEHIANYIADDHLKVELSYVNETRRKLHITANGQRASTLFTQFKRNAFGVK